LSRLIKSEYIDLYIEPGSKEEILERLIMPFVQNGDISVDDRSRLLKDLANRESILSTAIEGGIAFPHLRTPADNPVPGPLIHIARCPKGTQFGSRDGSLTHIFFFICTGSIAVHLRVTAGLARAMIEHDLANLIIKAKSGDEVLACFLEHGI
jgi:mannitol/fructose-specific phosphotransferase system IIA component (Ntr-type)